VTFRPIFFWKELVSWKLEQSGQAIVIVWNQAATSQKRNAKCFLARKQNMQLNRHAMQKTETLSSEHEKANRTGTEMDQEQKSGSSFRPRKGRRNEQMKDAKKSNSPIGKPVNSMLASEQEKPSQSKTQRCIMKRQFYHSDSISRQHVEQMGRAGSKGPDGWD